MAETMEDVIAEVKENLTENATNGTTKIPSTPEGMALAYGSLVIMALIPILVGSLRSVNHHKEQKVSGNAEKVTRREAAMFPIIASGALLGLYILFQIFSKDLVNLLLTGYFFALGVFSLCHLLSPVISSLVPSSIPNKVYTFQFKQKSANKDQNDQSENEEFLIDYSFKSHDIVCLICCLGIGAWYLLKKHWIANNMFGMAFAVHGVEVLFLNNVVNGCILLGGLFFYDIFWVFGTNVMVTVAHSFDAPIKLIFPQDLLEKGLSASNFAMLGLGDIVIPGIFIALLLRFDLSLNRKSRIYFISTFIAYFIGLMTTIGVMYVFKHAQPALLYLVPACIFPPMTLALCKGDIHALLQYEDHPAEEKVETAEKSGEEKKSK